MKKELLKGFMMLLLIVVMAIASAAVSNAQSNRRVVATIPFEFSIDYKTLPAGDYTIQTLASAGDALLIQKVDGSTSVFRQSNAIDSLGKESPACLVFHRYGQRYFLAEVWNGSNSGGRRLPKSNPERAFERELDNIGSNTSPAESGYEAIVVLASAR